MVKLRIRMIRRMIKIIKRMIKMIKRIGWVGWCVVGWVEWWAGGRLSLRRDCYEVEFLC